MKKIYFAMVAAVCILLAFAQECHTPPSSTSTVVAPTLDAGHKIVLESLGPQPFIPTSWTIPNWYIDPTNESGCSSDNNSCTSATCGDAGANIGPCSTYAQVAARWGTYSPRLQQNTTITFLSSQNNFRDPVYFSPFVENGAAVNIVGALGATQTVASGTLATVVAKVRAHPGQLWQADLGTSLAESGQYLVDVTQNAHMYVFASVSGTTFTLSEPLQPSGLGLPFPAEVEPLVDGDQFVLYSPVSVYFVQVNPVINVNTSAYQTLGIQHVSMLDPSTGHGDAVQLGLGVSVYESVISPIGALVGTSSVFSTTGPAYINDYALAGYLGSHATFYSMFVGGVSGGGDIWNGFLDGDIILSGSYVSRDLSYVGSAYIGPSQGIVSFTGSVIIDFTLNAAIYPYTPAVWGPGSIDAERMSAFYYLPDAGAAAATFLCERININEGIVACNGSNSVLPTACNISLTPALLDTAVGSGGFGGNAWVPGGGSINNTESN